MSENGLGVHGNARSTVTLQEMHKFFLVDQHLAATQRSKRQLILFFSRLVHDQRCLRHRNRPMAWAAKLFLANPDRDPLWKRHFQVTLPTFNALCDLVPGDLQKQHTRMCSPVSVEARVAVALGRLATGDIFKSCGLQFGIGMSTAKTLCRIRTFSPVLVEGWSSFSDLAAPAALSSLSFAPEEMICGVLSAFRDALGMKEEEPSISILAGSML